MNSKELNKNEFISPNLQEIALEFERVFFSYQKNIPLLKNINFKIFAGEYIAVIGANGSGKSTLGKLMSGIEIPDEGKIKIFGQTLNRNNFNSLRKDIGIVFQNPDDQFIGTTVRNDIITCLENNCIPREEMDKILNEVIKEAQIDEKYLDFEPSRLSGGQKQQVAVASMLAIFSKIIIFDEANTMLDPKGKKIILQIVRKLLKKGKTIIFFTHDMNEAINADWIMVINKGEIIFFDKPANIFQKHEILREMKLDLPFILKLSLGLKEMGCKIKPTIEEDDLIKQLSSYVNNF